MTHTRKVVIEPDKYNEMKEIEVDNLKVPGVLSPFDIPHGATATYDSSQNTLKIVLNYLTPDEPKFKIMESDHVSLALGKRSGKLYDVLITNFDPNSLEDVQVELFTLIGELADRSGRDEPHNYVKMFNLLAAKKILESEADLYSVEP